MNKVLESSSVQITEPWTDRVRFRHLTKEDLPDLEWEGEYRHFRKVYHKVYLRTRRGVARMWGVELANIGLVGQVFVQIPDSPSENNTSSRQAYIHSFRIRPAYRRAGLGSKLMHIVEGDLRENGFDLVSLNVGRTNYSARRLYARLGYKVVNSNSGRWRYYDHRGILRHVHEPCWCMQKNLKPEDLNG